jgi:quercetin dioxygenase-like cupin family protein
MRYHNARNYTYFAELPDQIGDIPPDSIVSRILFSNDHVKIILFGFAAGQELSEHTAATPAVIHILKGQGRLTFGDDLQEAKPGTCAYMPAQLPHSLVAETPLTMLLLLIK